MFRKVCLILMLLISTSSVSEVFNNPRELGRALVLANGFLPKHYYCWQPSSEPESCKTCWSNVGGEGGRVDCAARMGAGLLS